MTVQAVRVSPAWLRLREPADAAARASDLVEPIRMRLPERGRAVIHDLGSGTGSMGRWLAPQLAGSQHWVLYDHDAVLLAHAREDHRVVAADGAPVTRQTRQRDITCLRPGELAGASLVTASAVLDMLTAAELERFVAACAEARCPCC